MHTKIGRPMAVTIPEDHGMTMWVNSCSALNYADRVYGRMMGSTMLNHQPFLAGYLLRHSTSFDGEGTLEEPERSKGNLAHTNVTGSTAPAG
jgi:hypothetical protein